MPKRPFLIGVAGGSSSGKTTVAERLAELAGTRHLALIKLDSYYVDLSDRPMAEREAFDFDHPDAFDWSLLNDHLAALAAGASVPVPVYDYVQYNRSGEVKLVHPAPIIVVEGILVLWEPTLRERFDLKVFVDTDADIRLIRRLRRDAAERGRIAESVIEQYLTTVRPAHEQFIEPSKRYADVIVPSGRPQPPRARRPARPRRAARRQTDDYATAGQSARDACVLDHRAGRATLPLGQDRAMTFAHPAFDNRVSRDLGVDIPIVQAPMGWIARSQLASAVSQAGACGIIETSSGELDAVKDEIRLMRDLTDKPVRRQHRPGVRARPQHRRVRHRPGRQVRDHVGRLADEVHEASSRTPG